MVGKGAARSKSTPKERPQTSFNNSNNNPYAFSKSSYGGPSESPRMDSPSGPRLGSPSGPRMGSPSGPRKMPALNLASSSFQSSSSPSSPHTCSARHHHSGEKCICGICTCGQHKCPVQQKTNIFYGGDSSFCTTTNDTFVPHDSRHYATKASRGQQVYVPGERFEHTTTQQADYPWHTRERPSSSHFSRSAMERSTPSPLMHSHPDLRMDLSTTYGSQFVEHSIPSKSAKPAQASYSYGSPRDFTSTKQSDFAGLQPARCPATVLPSRQPSARSGHVKYNMDLTGTWR